ncbi:hypothetical protein, partial [Streptococcus pyogenes]|uniref:hypothetical protein n=1 Tax=Streptococcus pyogenes TaxID=1314 RepID=UPI000FF5D6D3
DKAGANRWHAIPVIIARGWDDVLGAIDDIATTPEVDEALSAKAEDELAEERDDEETDEADEAAEAPADATEPDEEALEADEADGEPDDDADETETRAAGDTVVLGGNKDFWLQVGIDPIRIITGSGTFYTLRCYLDDQPIFLGRNGRISVFTS